MARNLALHLVKKLWCDPDESGTEAQCFGPFWGRDTMVNSGTRSDSSLPHGERSPLPEAVAAAVLEFCDAALAVNPHRIGKPLFGPLAGCHCARRGTYRIVYRIDENSRVVHVLDVGRRSEIYHRPQQLPARGALHARGSGQHQA